MEERDDGPGGDGSELGALQAEVDELAEELDQLDAALKEAREALATFEARYRQMIAGRLAKVEELQARLAALRGRPDAEAEARAEQAARVAEELTPEERRKSMWKRIHPDRATDDADRAEREELMKRLNNAWDRQDWAEFDLVEAEIDRRTLAEAPPDERRRILERVRFRLIQQLAVLRSSLEELQRTALWRLLQQVEEARTEGRDLLQEQADELDAVTQSLRDEIDDLEREGPVV